jgi:maltoporin
MLAAVAVAGEVEPAPLLPGSDPVTDVAQTSEQKDLNLELVPPGTIIADPSMGPEGQRTRFNGYLRAGLGLNDDGGAMDRFYDSRIGRLGNEDDLYGEAAISHDLAYEGEHRWYVTLRLALADGNMAANGTTNDSLSVGLPEAFVGADNLFGHGCTVWLGRRFYHRRDVHVTDFYYQDFSGNGVGVDKWDFGGFTASAAVIINGGNLPGYGNGNAPADQPYTVAESENGRPALTAFTTSIDLDPLAFGQLSIEAVFGGSASGTLEPEAGGVEEEYDSLVMGGVGAYLKTPFGKRGRNILAVQGGLGSSTPFNLPSVPTAELMAVEGTGSERDRTPYLFRVVEDIALKDTANLFGVAGTLVGEWSDSGSDGDRSHRRFDAVARGVWWWDRHFGTALEPGSSWIDAPGAPDRISKITATLQMRVADTMATRPILRLFVTYAHWNEESAAVGDTHADERHGWNVGAQAEAWW